ncbi:MAG: cytochrome c553 [Verrucomicrobiales bacterium]|jgi:cytochrome c553
MKMQRAENRRRIPGEIGSFPIQIPPMHLRRFTLLNLALISSLAAADPVFKWSFDDKLDPAAAQTGTITLTSDGPTAPEFPDFPEKNPALELSRPSWIALQDEGADSRFDFDNGDEFTAEAWVNLDLIDQQACILTKGRTGRPGFPSVNQNWALRLRKSGSGACVNFLFRSRKNGDHPGDWHRWTSGAGFAAGSGWHHVAVTYKFGDPKSIRGYLDGQEVKGKWDMGGETTQPPVVDDDEVWIGSTMKGSLGNCFDGKMDEIALYRTILSPEELKSRWNYKPKPLPKPEIPEGKILVQMFGPISKIDSIPTAGIDLHTEWEQAEFAFTRVPQAYDDWGVREDWGKTVLVRAWGQIELPAGNQQLLVRSAGMARLWIDDEILVTTRKQPNRGGAHHVVDPLPEVPIKGMRPAAMNDDEKLIEFESAGGKHTVLFEIIVGGPAYRMEFGETVFATAKPGEMFQIVGGRDLTDEGWLATSAEQGIQFKNLDATNRRAKNALQAGFWKERHDFAYRTLVADATPRPIDDLIERRIAEVNREAGGAEVSPGDQFYQEEIEPLLAEACYRCHGDKVKGGLDMKVRENLLVGGDSEIPAIVPGKPEESFLIELVTADPDDDRMPPKGDGLTADQIAALKKWIAEGAALPTEATQTVEISPIVGDETFLRRAFLDTVGVPPNLAEAKAFLEDNAPDKRAKLVEQLLADDRWADNWVGYWQDVLAENPNILKPKLNNTGPFRYWIREAMADNKPMDRFATELIQMRGSAWYGGTAGFAIATENDVPMAAKAHVIGSAFLGVEMKCARCHDAPYHDWKQGDLFQMAAMLGRQPIKLPASSTVPAAFFEKQSRESLIEVTLKPGEAIQPDWPFAEFAPEVPDAIIGNSKDTRLRLAAQVTASGRFAEVVANRVWARFMGAGVVDPVDDWEGAKPSNPELLARLTDELILSGYDLKHLAQVIMNSKSYQREAVDAPINSPAEDRLFEGPYRRRMSAEQIVDSAFASVGQSMVTEELTLDVEGSLAGANFLNFGFPQRAWEFSTMGNERDRPSLALPRAQAIADTLKAFGWRNSRPEPLTEREEEPNLIQPGVLANGVMGTWLTRLTDESGLTAIAIRDVSLQQLLDDIFLQIVTRKPTDEERERFTALLSSGYDDRVIPEAQVAPKTEPHRFRYVSWSNHLNTEANVIKVEMEEAARQGDPPTRFLRSEWRERMEDAVWALLNSPEMVMMP